MSWLSNWSKRFKLTQSDRQLITQLFGSFRSNQFSTDISTLIQQGYEENVDGYALIKKIADVYSSFPWIVERKMSDGTWELFEKSTINDLLANPNSSKGYTMDDIDEQTIIYLLASGNVFTVGNTQINKTLIEEIDILPSQSVKISSSDDFFLPNPKYTFEIGQTKRTFDMDEISNILLFNPNYQQVKDSFRGLSIIEVAKRVVQVGNDRWDADANILQNRGAIGLISDLSDRPMTEPEAQQVQTSFERRTAGTHNYGKTVVTNKNLKYIPMAMSPTDLQLLEKGVVNLRSMCNVFGLDSSLFNDPDNKKFDNVVQAEKAMFTNAIFPITKKITDEYNRFIVKNHHPFEPVRMRKDYSKAEALQSDKKTEAEKDKIMVEGINVVVNMPVSNAAKVELLKETYDLSEDTIKAILNTPNNDTSM